MTELRSESFDEPRADALEKQLCDAGRAHSCASIAMRLPLGKARTALEQKTFAMRRVRCEEERDAGECFDIGRDLDAPTHVPKFRDPGAAAPWFKKGCELGHGESCLAASTALSALGNGDEALVFRKRYLEMAESLCAAPCPVACANLAYALERGEDLPADRARAKVLDRKACASGGVAGACEHAQAP